MTDRTPNLDLPFILPSQAQKHVTHNEALEVLDAVTQLCLEAADLDLPPATAAEGACYGIGPGATGDWLGQDGRVALWSGGGWMFLDPAEGWRAWDRGAGRLLVRRGDSWEVLSLQNVSQLGVNASADAGNRLVVGSDAVLLTHAGGGHLLKINKAGASQTASVLYQSEWSGHAEVGLAGNNDLSFKVSADGSEWVTALALDAESGIASGSAVQQASTDTTEGRLMRADWGYGPGNSIGAVAMSGGLPAGALIERGGAAGSGHVRWADGTQIAWGRLDSAALAIDVLSGGAFASAALPVAFSAAFSAVPSVVVTGGSVSGAADGWAIARGISAGGFQTIHVKLSSTAAEDRTLTYVATGRWA